MDIPFGSKLHQMVKLPGQRIMMLGGEKNAVGLMSNGIVSRCAYDTIYSTGAFILALEIRINIIPIIRLLSLKSVPKIHYINFIRTAPIDPYVFLVFLSGYLNNCCCLSSPLVPIVFVCKEELNSFAFGDPFATSWRINQLRGEKYFGPSARFPIRFSLRFHTNRVENRSSVRHDNRGIFTDNFVASDFPSDSMLPCCL